MEKILQKKQEEICKDILKQINNEKVNVEIDEKTKSSLYVFLTDTIYISNKFKKGKSIDDQNKVKALVIAHECAHSIQSKVQQIINFILANLEILLFIAVLTTRVFFKRYDVFVNSYITVNILSIFIRWYLEMNATINSVIITAKYMLQNNVEKEKIKNLVLYYKKELLKSMPIFIFYLFVFKIVRLTIAMLV